MGEGKREIKQRKKAPKGVLPRRSLLWTPGTQSPGESLGDSREHACQGSSPGVRELGYGHTLSH